MGWRLAPTHLHDTSIRRIVAGEPGQPPVYPGAGVRTGRDPVSEALFAISGFR